MASMFFFSRYARVWLAAAPACSEAPAAGGDRPETVGVSQGGMGMGPDID